MCLSCVSEGRGLSAWEVNPDRAENKLNSTAVTEYEYLHEQIREGAVKICNSLESKRAFTWKQWLDGKNLVTHFLLGDAVSVLESATCLCPTGEREKGKVACQAVPLPRPGGRALASSSGVCS